MSTPDIEPTEPEELEEHPDTTVVFVSRSRTLSLGGMVIIALAVGALAGVIWVALNGANALGTIVLGGLYGAMFIGGALAGVAVFIDWLLERLRS